MFDQIIALLLCLMMCVYVRGQCTKPHFEGDVVLSEKYISTDSFLEGERVTFECIPGYKPVNQGASRSVTCQGNQWTNLELRCTRKSCKSPPEFQHGRYEILSGILFGDTIRASCDTGYVLFGPPERTCRAEGEWDGRDNECEEVSCVSPPNIENGEIEGGYEMNMEYKYAEVVTYRCLSGFTLVGKADLVCSENGTFHPQPPKCVDGCVTPTVANGKRISAKSPPYKLNNFIDYRCDDNYDMEGEDHIVCTENGWRPQPPQCIGFCGRPVFGSGVVISKAFDSHNKFPKGSNATFECLSGYKAVDLKASNVVTCLETAWTPLELKCKEVYCGPPVFGGHVIISSQFTAENKFSNGSSVTFECKSGYKAIDSKASNVVTCVDTVWTKLNLVCKGYCGIPVFGGHVISQSFDSVDTFPDGTKLEFECLSGYKAVDLKASNVVTCLETQWTPLQLRCEGEEKPGQDKSVAWKISVAVCSLLVLGGVIAGIIYYKKRHSKHEYSHKVATDNEEGEL